MKKKIYDYVCNHSHSSIHEIASALDMQELEALRIVHILMKAGYVRMDSPVPISSTNSDSCYYSATGKTL